MLMGQRIKATFQNAELQPPLSLEERQAIRKKAKKQVKSHNLKEGVLIVEANAKKWQVLFFKDAHNTKQYYLVDEAKKLGKGAQGEVFLAIHCQENEWAAVKKMQPKSISFDDDFKREKKNLERCDRFLGALTDKEGNAYLLMHYCSGMNLLNYLYITDETKDEESAEYFAEKKQIDYKLKLRLVTQVFEEIIRLHGLGLAHRDLKTANLIIDRRGVLDHFLNLKLVDLGTAVYRGRDKPENFTEMAGTFGYNDPYLKGYYDYPNDLFSLGIVIAEIFTNFNYQAALKRKRLEFKEVGLNGKMEELSLKDIQEIMPDMFVYAENNEEASAEEQIQFNVLQQIRSILFLLMQEDMAQRPTLDRLKDYHQSLKSLMAKATIESTFHNPGQSYRKYSEGRGSSPRQERDAIAAAASIPPSPLSPKSARAEANGESAKKDELQQLAELLEQASMADYADPSVKPTLSQIRTEITSGESHKVTRGLTFLKHLCRSSTNSSLSQLKEKTELAITKQAALK